MSTKQIPEQHKKKFELLAIYLRELRLCEGLSQEELSHEVNLHRNSIIRAENGKNLTLLSVFELANAFSIPVNQLFEIFEESGAETN
jgi:transcriptional regulator with XRE-family HTH domain